MSKNRFLFGGVPILLTVSFSMAALAQESSSRPEAIDPPAPPTSLESPVSVPAPDGPSAALRDLLSAACSHDETTFSKFLTARNAEAFSRLTPSARTELMKRFVLLDGAGKPYLTSNPSGRPSIRCTTSDGAAAIQLGGTELHDNIAFLPVDIRDVSELQGGDPHHIQMSMVRENSSWKILSLGMLFFDLPALEIEWDQAAIGANERGAIIDLKAIAEAIETYRKNYSRLPDSLLKLGHASKPSAEAAGLLEVELSSGQSNGYRFKMVIVGASEIGAPAEYELSATPVTYGRTGKLSFFRDAKGKFHAGDHQGAVGRTVDPVVP
jgi:hypothetical protein